MAKLFSILLLVSILFISGDCRELSGGESISVIGKGSSGEGSTPPVYNSPKTTVITRDPANYMNPAVTISKTTPSTDTSTEDNDNLSSSGKGTGTLAFSMTSDVAGTGRFSERSKLSGRSDEVYKAYSSISAIYGDLTQSRKMQFFEDRQDGSEFNYIRTYIDTQDAIRFFGRSYSDILKIQNKEDLINENIRAGAISKTSRITSQHLQVGIDDNVTKTLHNNYTVYNIDTQFVGSSDLHSVTNGTDIMQSYIGQIELNRKIVSQFMSNDTLLADVWLPCCNSSFSQTSF